MKFPESWLREHVAVTADRATLAATLTAVGLEVEAMNEIGSALDGVVVAHILECSKHPEADRLQVCRVSLGASEVQIVCGAPNARAGLKAPLATVGATLPGGTAIKAAKLRGVESFGMLCSAKELGIDPDASGLLELPADAPAGAPLAQYLGLPDASFELKLTPNRADCFSVRGLAFDVAAALQSAVSPLPIEPVPAQSDAVLGVELEAGAKVPRFVGRVIDGVDSNAPTPVWMAERLRRSGVRPISFLVDVTQYVMLELGQPMHAFDKDTLQGPVVVRPARAGEQAVLLDGRSVELDDDFLVVSDSTGGHAARAVALGGIMGGLDTRVTDATRSVFLEAAHWIPSAIIGRSRKLGLHTDAGHRFERGVDPNLPRLAIERATRLILDVAGGTPGPVIEASRPSDLRDPAPLRLRRARVRRVLGLDIADAEIERILSALGMHASEREEGWEVTPPLRRFDISIEEDLIEEIARIHGYDRIPLHAPTGQIQLASLPEARIPDLAMRQQMAARGFFEAVNFAFLDAATLAKWNHGVLQVELANPLSADLGVMRPALLPGLVEAAKRNLARQQPRVRLFEAGRVFEKCSDAPRETRRLAAVAIGPAQAEQWGAAARAADFHDLKGELESLLALAGSIENIRYTPAAQAWLHPGRSAEVWRGDTRLGLIGHLHPRLLKALDLDQEALVFELDLEPLADRQVPRAGELSRFPQVRRDLAVVVAEEVPWARLEASLRAALGGLLREVRVFDRYVGPGLEAGFKSLAMGLILQDASRTLTDLDADGAVAAALAALDRDCGAKLRG
ncbi:MAG: phenylalanine--tRNA ligase subunit beta [Chiayiivirga sp.]|jgi:phenylalanyl-tRNA synthetase beta chain|uniref:phenylalanine--tRNA ligase subunit beta n=1 Tax=Chiayiivirga sp. TaxID=2041042 RepID=UPI0025C3F51F|nr:phenylalanine--tRNA ligase subunit beta [Chiayiivirga sp.]MCI1729264.1 phenylalanine--tRNA ligase subunit beta [Chiayiivirga sp.]